MKIHIVQKGDTLWKLAKKYGVSYEQLKKSNSQLSNPDMMMPGMKINIPGNTSGMIKKEMGSPQVNYQSKETQIQPMQMKEQQIKQQPVIKEQQKYQPPVKEKQIVQQPVIKEYQQPKPIIKEYQQPVIKEKEIVVQKEVQVPTPVIPEIDINNYYMVNMTNMSVQKPPTPPAPPKKVEPVVEKKVEKPVKKKAKKKPVVQEICEPMDDCIPITPIMPGSGFCIDPPPWAHMPVQGIQGVNDYQGTYQGVQGMQGYQMMEESSDVWGESSDMYMMNQNNIQGAGNNQAGQQYYPYQASAPVPHHMYGGPSQQVAGSFMKHEESSSESSSSSEDQKFQVYPQQSYNMPIMQAEEDCGCNKGVLGTYGPEKGVKGKYSAADEIQSQAHHHPDYHQFHKGRPQQQYSGAFAEASFQSLMGEGQQQPIQYEEESLDEIQVQDFQLGQLPGGMMGNQPGNQMGGMMGNQPGNQMGGMMGNQPGNQMGNMMGNQPGNQMGNMMGNQPGNQMGGMMGNQPGNQMGNMMGNQPGNQMGNMMGNQPGNQMGG
ncbi:SafA/ExsA family spore coat assembly protein, partial [Peribacillus sp. NPDC097295]|uniref:SafA/ExsA family spore coat assembly protein n=1 Tax=Peribacillus sp. NPDC097295 TaxID=3364402 RepID=UPI00382386EE